MFIFLNISHFKSRRASSWLLDSKHMDHANKVNLDSSMES